MLEFDLETWCAEWSYATFAEEKAIIEGMRSPDRSLFDSEKLQQIRSIEKANGLDFG